MALNQRETELIQWGKANGKETSEILLALRKMREEEAAPKGKTGIAGFALGAGKQIVGGLQDLGRIIAKPLPGDSKDLGIPDEKLQPQSEAERAGAKTAFVGELASGAAGLAKGAVKGLVKGGSDLFTDKKLRETIQPKTTGKSGQKLVEEGRVIQGRSNPLTGKAKDIIVPDEKLLRAEQVIVRDLPGDHKDSYVLANSIKQLIGKRARQLSPEMKKVSISDDTRQFMTDEWGKLQKLQRSSDFFEDNLSTNMKFQQKFQKFFDEAIDAGNLDELWEIRKKYDGEFDFKIKNPSPNAPLSTQIKNEMWLQNRSVLNDVIEDASRGLGDTARNAFDDMSSLYSARTNIITKSKIDLKGKPGPINPRSSLKFLLGVGTGAAGTAIAF